MNASESPFVMVITTTASREQAESIATHLLQHKLAACVQIDGPLSSHFVWQGKLDFATEFRTTIKTRRELWPQIQTVLGQIHPYEVPQIILVPILDAAASYGEWLLAETTR